MSNERDKKLSIVFLIYILCFIFRGFEYFVLRTDQTFWGEAFIHKLIGIMIFYVAAKMYGMNLKNIGFVRDSVLNNLLKGLGFGLLVFIVAYVVEILILVVQNKFAMVQIYVSAYIMAPIRSYCDGMIGVSGFIANMVMLIITSGIIGFKFCLLTKMTGSLYMGMSDHFVNNTVVNMFHIISDTGVDELQVVRIAVAQSLSFIIVLVFYMRNYKRMQSR